LALNISKTYNFQALENDELITECFERIGISGEQLVPVKLNSARRSLNLLLLDWISKSLNLWTLKTAYLSLNAGQSKYILPSTVTDINQLNLRQFTRQLNGVAQSNTLDTYDNLGGGIAKYAFDNILSDVCIQEYTNGSISYDYGIGVSRQINFVGISSNTDTPYTLLIETSNDHNVWKIILTIPKQEFKSDEALWFDITTPISARYYRIREIGGETLNIQEIYFTNKTSDLQLTPVSRDSYLSFFQKSIQGRPTCYYFDKQIVPIINIWYPPISTYKVIQYSYTSIMHDAGGFYNIADIPPTMLPALTWGLSWMLAIKYNPEMMETMKNEYEQSFALASANDSENIGLTIDCDVSGYNEN
tara:strand:- start:2347 stop:3429 length:1083 start_codon:yes stop_codon:yes gene_type:complete